MPLDCDMPHWLSAALRLLAIAVGLNAVLHLAVLLFGWPAATHSVVGAGLIALGGLLSTGGSGGRHLTETAQYRALDARDLEQYGSDLRKNFNAGILFCVIGIVTLALGIVLK